MAHAGSANLAETIDPVEVSDLALALGRISSPSGHEHEASDYVFDWCLEAGLAPARLRPDTDRAANILARIPGAGGGRSLLFNSHLDTAVQPGDTTYFRDPERPEYRTAWRDGDDLVGIGVVNDKGPMAAWLVAAARLRQSGLQLRGDVLLSAVTGEIGFEPVDEFQGPGHHGKDFGSRYVATHGGVADFVLVAETTSFVPVWVEPGKAFFRIEVPGRPSGIYTPYLQRPYDPVDEPNAVVRAARLIPRLEAWALDYQTRTRSVRPAGEVVPKVNIGAIRAGHPSQPVLTPAGCRLYLDVRLAPGAGPLDVLHELRDLAPEAEVTCYLFRRGYEAVGADTVVSALREATRHELGPDHTPTTAHTASSMWRDINVWNELGMPAVTFGPGVGTGGGNARLSIEELAQAARIYLRVMTEVCELPRR